MRHVLLLLAIVLPALVTSADDKSSGKVDAVFAQFTSTTPGCALGVIQDGKLAYSKGYGMASLELGVPITPQTVFDIGSTSKQITATAIVLLAQQGRLSLDDNIRKWVPELPDYDKAITLHHLLHHTSGIRDYIGLLELSGAQEEAVTTDDDALGILVKQKGLNFAPGDDYLYSNSNFFLLSLVVKRASGKTLRQFAAENIFAPLAMKDTQYLDDHQQVVLHKAASYATSRDHYVTVISNWEQTGDGAVNTTIEDLAKWDQNFYHPKVGGEALVKELQTPGMLNDGSKLTYADGLVVDEYRGLRRVSHGGAWEGFRTELMRFPDQHFSVALQCNLANSNPTQLASKVAEIYLDREMSPPPAAEQPKGNDDLSRYVGTYWSANNFAIQQVSLRDGKLWARGLGLMATLISQGNGMFSAPAGGHVRFEQVEGGEMRMIAMPKGVAPITLVRVPETRPPDLSALAGDYVSEELNGVRVSLTLKDASLVLRWPQDALRFRFEEIPLTAFTADVFSARGRLLKFQDNGFVLAAGRERGMRFVRVVK